jgi:hypothetical protein
MTASIVVYTCVFGSYDRVFPPVRPEHGVDYVMLTDDAANSVAGWRTVVVDTTRFRSRKGPNRYFKMLAHRRELPRCDVSVYVDGNLRVLGGIRELAEAFLREGVAVGMCAHPLRSSVAEEAECCLARRKVQDERAVRAELAAYVADGFPDRAGLHETGVILKNHGHSALDPAMDLWWECFERYDTRDQLSFPYVRWKLGLATYEIKPSFRAGSRCFGIYPHFGDRSIRRGYAYCAARSFDSRLHALALAAWELKWQVQRRLRPRKGL